MIFLRPLKIPMDTEKAFLDINAKLINEVEL
jgi:hypothetical protein